jgi:hypothetical protein
VSLLDIPLLLPITELRATVEKATLDGVPFLSRRLQSDSRNIISKPTFWLAFGMGLHFEPRFEASLPVTRKL